MFCYKKSAFALMIFVQLLNVCFCQNVTDDLSDTNVNESRTFGHHFLKRISFAIIPAAFVVGVITTLLAALTVVSLKGLGVGVILLVIALGQILARSIPTAVPYQQNAPLPLLYAHRHLPEAKPILLENAWR